MVGLVQIISKGNQWTLGSEEHAALSPYAHQVPSLD